MSTAAPTVDPAAPAAPERGRRWRTALAVVLFLIAGLLAPVGLVGAWAARTISDTDRYVATISPLLDSPEVREELTDRITESLLTQVDVQALLQQTLPPQLQPLDATIANGLQSFVRSQVGNLLASDQVQQIWDQLNAELQSRLIAALKGDNSGAIQVQGDEVVLDTGVLFQKVKDLLVERGFTIFQRVPLPSAADRQIVLVKSDQIRTISTVYRITEPIANALIFVVLLLMLIATLLLRRRRIGIAISGWILVLSGAALLLGLNTGRTVFLSQQLASDSSWQAVTFDTLVRYLQGLCRAAITLGAIAIIGGWLAGRGRVATYLREGTVRLTDAAGAELARWWPGVRAIGEPVSRAQPFLGLAIVVIGIIALIAPQQVSAGRAVWIAVIGLVVWLLVLVLAGTGRAADATTTDAPQEPADAAS